MGYASTSKIEEEERARRANDSLLQQRQHTRHQKIWPEFSRRIDAAHCSSPSPSQPVVPSQPAAARCVAAHYSAPSPPQPAVTPSDVALSDIECINLSMDMDSDDDFDWDL